MFAKSQIFCVSQLAVGYPQAVYALLKLFSLVVVVVFFVFVYVAAVAVASLQLSFTLCLLPPLALKLFFFFVFFHFLSLCHSCVPLVPRSLYTCQAAAGSAIVGVAHLRLLLLLPLSLPLLLLLLTVGQNFICRFVSSVQLAFKHLLQQFATRYGKYRKYCKAKENIKINTITI